MFRPTYQTALASENETSGRFISFIFLAIFTDSPLTHQEQQRLCSSSREVVTSCGGIINSFVEKATEKQEILQDRGEGLNQQTDIKRTLILTLSWAFSFSITAKKLLKGDFKVMNWA